MKNNSRVREKVILLMMRPVRNFWQVIFYQDSVLENRTYVCYHGFTTTGNGAQVSSTLLK